MSDEIKTTEEEVKEEQAVEETVTDTTEENTESAVEENTEKEKKSESKGDKKDNKSKGLLAIIAVLTILLIGMIVYVASNSTKNSVATKEAGETVNKQVLIDALNNLKKKDKFIISTFVNAPMGNTSYIEYVTPEFSATLVDDSHLDEPYQQIDKTTLNYRFNDLIKDGHMYFYYENQDVSGNNVTEVYQAPDAYAKECDIRKYMFFDLMKDNIKDLKYREEATTDLGNGEVTMQVYSGVIDSSIVKRIMGNGTIVLYDSVMKTTDNEGLKKMMGWLKDDIEFTMEYSDANILIGIVDDTLAYVNLEIGGLGTKMYVTKCYIEDTSVADSLTVPDTTNATAYEELYAEYADMAVNYDSMEDLYSALYADNNPYTSEELQQILDNIVEEENASKETTEEGTTSSNTENTTDESTENTEESEPTEE